MNRSRSTLLSRICCVLLVCCLIGQSACALQSADEFGAQGDEEAFVIELTVGTVLVGFLLLAAVALWIWYVNTHPEVFSNASAALGQTLEQLTDFASWEKWKPAERYENLVALHSSLAALIGSEQRIAFSDLIELGRDLFAQARRGQNVNDAGEQTGVREDESLPDSEVWGDTVDKIGATWDLYEQMSSGQEEIIDWFPYAPTDDGPDCMKRLGFASYAMTGVSPERLLLDHTVLVCADSYGSYADPSVLNLANSVVGVGIYDVNEAIFDVVNVGNIPVVLEPVDEDTYFSSPSRDSLAIAPLHQVEVQLAVTAGRTISEISVKPFGQSITSTAMRVADLTVTWLPIP
ncbi:MAG: hypothetical protein IPJ88_04525 [Myxococcales bacterium]|nr:MAG: hypothetical protein IPJ88_04525 [Myxococcales bacterium]